MRKGLVFAFLGVLVALSASASNGSVYTDYDRDPYELSAGHRLILPGTNAKAISLAVKDLAKRHHSPADFNLSIQERPNDICVDSLFRNKCPQDPTGYNTGGIHYSISKEGDRILNVGHWR